MSVSRLSPEDIPQMMTGLMAAFERGAEARARGEVIPRPDQCGGALLKLTKQYARGLEQGGYRFATKVEFMNEDGFDTIRVRCEGREVFKRMQDGTETVYGLCAACIGLEKGNRDWLRLRARHAAEEQRPAVSRRGDLTR